MPGLQHPQAGIFAVALIDRPAVMPRDQTLQGGGVQDALPPFPAVIVPAGKVIFGLGGHIGQKDLPAELPALQQFQLPQGAVAERLIHAGREQGFIGLGEGQQHILEGCFHLPAQVGPLQRGGARRQQSCPLCLFAVLRLQTGKIQVDDFFADKNRDQQGDRPGDPQCS